MINIWKRAVSPVIAVRVQEIRRVLSRIQLQGGVTQKQGVPPLPPPSPSPPPPPPFLSLPAPPLLLEVGPIKTSQGVWGSAVSSPIGVWGGAPAEIEFCAF